MRIHYIFLAVMLISAVFISGCVSQTTSNDNNAPVITDETEAGNYTDLNTTEDTLVAIDQALDNI